MLSIPLNGFVALRPRVGGEWKTSFNFIEWIPCNAAHVISPCCALAPFNSIEWIPIREFDVWGRRYVVFTFNSIEWIPPPPAPSALGRCKLSIPLNGFLETTRAGKTTTGEVYRLSIPLNGFTNYLMAVADLLTRVTFQFH